MNSLLFQIEHNCASIVLNRPDKFNAFNRDMSLKLLEALEECEKNIAVRCVTITGAGKAFSAGQDLAEVVDPTGPGLQTILSEHYNPIVRRIRTLSKPVIAAVNGVAAGAAANIALCCDIVVAAQSAAFIQAFSKIGLIPDSGGTFFLPRLIGFQRASAIMMLGDKIDAPTALNWGMVYKIFEDSVFEKATKELSAQVAGMATRGLSFTKQALNASMANNLEAQLALEDSLQQQAGQSNDFKEGVTAFLEKRKPHFKGD